jgi:hypothetical protein
MPFQAAATRAFAAAKMVRWVARWLVSCSGHGMSRTVAAGLAGLVA